MDRRDEAHSQALEDLQKQLDEALDNRDRDL